MSVGLASDSAGFPFPDFEWDDRHYSSSCRFWDEGFRQALGDEVGSWAAWMQDPLRDGHPMFSAINRKQGKGVLVQQVPVSDDVAWFKCWVDAFQPDDGPPIPYLFVETFVSDRGRALFTKLCEAWARPGMSVGEMEGLAEQVRSWAASAGPGA